jgi:elongation factor 1 alpha-like protein
MTFSQFFSSFCSLTSEENGLSVRAPHKGPPGDDVSVASPNIPETGTPKSALPPPSLQTSEELGSTPTPVRKSGKLRQQIDVKAELEKRQGGKQLLNLVVIGMPLFCPPG